MKSLPERRVPRPPPGSSYPRGRSNPLPETRCVRDRFARIWRRRARRRIGEPTFLTLVRAEPGTSLKTRWDRQDQGEPRLRPTSRGRDRGSRACAGRVAPSANAACPSGVLGVHSSAWWAGRGPVDALRVHLGAAAPDDQQHRSGETRRRDAAVRAELGLICGLRSLALPALVLAEGRVALATMASAQPGACARRSSGTTCRPTTRRMSSRPRRTRRHGATRSP